MPSSKNTSSASNNTSSSGTSNSAGTGQGSQSKAASCTSFKNFVESQGGKMYNPEDIQQGKETLRAFQEADHTELGGGYWGRRWVTGAR
ncbi:hypothetical protein EJ06DRAFT_553615 [Trichodelitschia bisporula]|uniref:Uncharacterized protein n=1 Tax=Trichodelitschia bisporula TaxID=703511 RepID=A0A6G1I9P5_9PEZI|nr:hypothetical protein EJ06DRAFT_553615 [Trichodelitschia bisporula]